MGRIKEWFTMNKRLKAMEAKPYFTLAEAIDRLKDCFVIVASDENAIRDVMVSVPDDKCGVLILGKRNLLVSSHISGGKTGVEISGSKTVAIDTCTSKL